jgi:N-acetylneuraminate synthase/N,N'-diacetyllegionaminate synthase
VQIEQLSIGPGHPAFIIAEAGVNHNGDLKTAMRLVEAAKAAGAQAVKFQTFSATDLVTAAAPKADYQIENTGATESQLQMLKNLELGEAEFAELAEFCRTSDILFLSTPYGARDIQLLAKWKVSAIKVASALTVEPRFLEEAASLGVPLIVSTGMMSLAEVAEATETLHHVAPDRFVLLQCVTNYPASVASSNLRAMQAMATAFQCPVGFSDHTESSVAAVVSVGLGACVLERHLTLDRTAEGPDHRASSNPEEFTRYVEAIRAAESALGNGWKRPAPEEIRNAAKMRRSIVSARALQPGQPLTDGDLAFKRPGTGISPAELDRIVGRRLRHAIPPDTLLRWSMFDHDSD